MIGWGRERDKMVMVEDRTERRWHDERCQGGLIASQARNEATLAEMTTSRDSHLLGLGV
jgi:hypothetical protein